MTASVVLWSGSVPAGYSPAGMCPDCGGPCLTYKGSVHRWRCIDCVERAIGLDRPPAPRRVPEWLAFDRRQEREECS